MSKFPIKTSMGLYRSKEDNYDIADDLNITDETFMNKFKHTGYEILMDVEIQKDGIVFALTLNGVQLEKPVLI